MTRKTKKGRKEQATDIQVSPSIMTTSNGEGFKNNSNNNNTKQLQKKKCSNDEKQQQHQQSHQKQPSPTKKKKKNSNNNKGDDATSGETGKRKQIKKKKQKNKKSKNKQTDNYLHLSHLPIKEQLREIMLSKFVIRGKVHLVDHPNPKTARATNEIWRLIMIGRKYLLKKSGSHAGQKKLLLSDATYARNALRPPFRTTSHARQRRKERGLNTIPRFKPRTFHTVIATFVPKTIGKINYQLYQKRKLEYYIRERAKERHVESIKIKKELEKIRLVRRYAKEKSLRNKQRKEIAYYKRGFTPRNRPCRRKKYNSNNVNNSKISFNNSSRVIPWTSLPSITSRSRMVTKKSTPPPSEPIPTTSGDNPCRVKMNNNNRGKISEAFRMKLYTMMDNAFRTSPDTMAPPPPPVASIPTVALNKNPCDLKMNNDKGKISESFKMKLYTKMDNSTSITDKKIKKKTNNNNNNNNNNRKKKKTYAEIVEKNDKNNNNKLKKKSNKKKKMKTGNIYEKLAEIAFKKSMAV